MTPATDTIAAIATAPGAGGVGIVRLSGPRARAIARSDLRSRARSRATRTTCASATQTATRIDDGIALYFAAPASYTGEDVVELQAHGSPVVLQRTGRALLRARRARRARPGEFSERAFLNGKLDLAQAEAVADLIAAGDTRAARAARRALDGEFSRRVDAHRRRTARRCACTSRRRSISPTNPSTRSAARELRARLAAPRARSRDLLADAERGRKPARRPARGDRRPAERRQELAAQRARRQRPRHRHRHRRHHPRPAARNRAPRRRRTDAGRHRRPARGRRCDRTRRHAPRARRTASAPTWRSSCSTRATRRRPRGRRRRDRRRARSACGCTTRPTCSTPPIADARPTTRCLCRPPAPAPGLDALHARLRALAAGDAADAGEGTFTARARHVDALRPRRAPTGRRRACSSTTKRSTWPPKPCAPRTTPSARSPAGSRRRPARPHLFDASASAK